MAKNASTIRLKRQAAAHESWARTADRAARTGPARQASEDRFERQIRERFPDLNDTEVAVRAKHLRRAHFLLMAAKSAEVRRARAGA